jgi:hypothetical protein
METILLRTSFKLAILPLIQWDKQLLFY